MLFVAMFAHDGLCCWWPCLLTMGYVVGGHVCLQRLEDKGWPCFLTAARRTGVSS